MIISRDFMKPLGTQAALLYGIIEVKRSAYEKHNRLKTQ